VPTSIRWECPANAGAPEINPKIWAIIMPDLGVWRIARWLGIVSSSPRNFLGSII
jgi:hypothetical protein